MRTCRHLLEIYLRDSHVFGSVHLFVLFKLVLRVVILEARVYAFFTQNAIPCRGISDSRIDILITLDVLLISRLGRWWRLLLQQIVYPHNACLSSGIDLDLLTLSSTILINFHHVRGVALRRSEQLRAWVVDRCASTTEFTARGDVELVVLLVQAMLLVLTCRNTINIHVVLSSRILEAQLVRPLNVQGSRTS